jgi:phage/plasmid-like protein (TIGR03299 family)
MAHELTERADGKVEMAYVGETPWHGLGQQLAHGADLDTWRVAAGMDWQVKRSRVRYGEVGPNQRVYDDAHVLFRSDTKAALGVVSPKYKIVNPGQVLEFFRDVADTVGGSLETAGTLFGGKKFWALAKLGESEAIRGNDVISQYLLLTSSCDGSSSTEARETIIRAVCNNTVSAALSVKTKHAIKVSHRTVFDANAVKRELASTDGHFGAFVAAARTLAHVSISNRQAEDFVAKLLADSTTREDVKETPGFQSIMNLFKGSALGGTLLSAEGTAWGLVNAVTEHVDHKARAKSADHRIAAAWFGRGDDLKTKAMEAALALA